MKILTLLSFIAIMLLAFQNCSSEHKESEFASQADQLMVDNKAKEIIVNKCMSCHGPGATVELSTNIQSLIDSGYIVDGEPQNSSLYLRIVDRVEPPSNSGIELSGNEIETIRKWIKGPSALNYVEHIRPILQSCQACHSNNNRRLNTYAELMKNNRIVPGDVQASTIWQRLISVDDDFRMPRGMAPLKQEELQILSDWIASGAKEYE